MWSFQLLAVIFILKVASGAVAPTKVLNDGHRIPVIALGTYGSANDIAKMRQAVNWAVEAGYRHIDTAAIYHNEQQIGEGIKDVITKGIVKREDLFITTKLWGDRHARDQVVPALRESLQRLGLDYVDLYLIHYPIGINPDNTPSDVDYLETWEGMVEAKRLGLTKSIGVSNFNAEQINRIIEKSGVVPAVNQIEVHPSLTNYDLTNVNQRRGITIMGYSPFGFTVARGNPNPPPPRIDDPDLVKIAQKYGKTTAQVLLRYQIERDLIPIPKSTNKRRIEENINIFDFQLTNQELRTIDSFNSNSRLFPGNQWKNHPYYPFNE